MNYIDKIIKEFIMQITETHEKELMEAKEVKKIIDKQIEIESKIVDILKEDDLVELFFEYEELENERENIYTEFYYKKGIKDGITLILKALKMSNPVIY